MVVYLVVLRGISVSPQCCLVLCVALGAVVKWNIYNGYEEGFSVASSGGTLGPSLRGFRMDQLQFLAESFPLQQWFAFASSVVLPQSIARDFNIGAIFVGS